MYNNWSKCLAHYVQQVFTILFYLYKILDGTKVHGCNPFMLQSFHYGYMSDADFVAIKISCFKTNYISNMQQFHSPLSSLQSAFPTSNLYHFTYSTQIHSYTLTINYLLIH